MKSFMPALEALEDRLCQTTLAGVSDGAEPIGMLLPAVQKVREAASRMVVDPDVGGHILPYKTGDETQEARRPYFKPGKELPVVLDEELVSEGKYSWAYMVRQPHASDEGSVRHRGFAIIDRTHVEAVDAYFKPGKELFADASDPAPEQTRQLTLIQDM